MVTIHNPDLEIEPVEDHPGRRLALVSYDLSAAPGDPMIGTTLVEVVRIHGKSSTGAPIKADTSPIVTPRRFSCGRK